MLRSIFTALLTVVALVLLVAPASAKQPSGAVVFSKVEAAPAHTEESGEASPPQLEGGLYAARNGRLNQLTENPADSQPSFSGDGRAIAFVRDGDIYSMRADGSGQHALTSGSDLDEHPHVAPNGRYVVFERRSGEGAPRDLYTVRIGGGGVHALTLTPEDEHEAAFAPDGRAIVFVRSSAEAGGGTSDDLYSVRPSGAGLAQLTHSARIDEFSPRYFRGGIVFSRGQSGGGPDAYADVFTMRRDGSRARELIAGAGSAFVEDVTPDGSLLLFRRDQGLWVKRLGRGRARKLTEVADNSATNAVFSSDGRRIAAFVATDEAESLSAVDVSSGRRAELAQGFSLESGSVATTIGPVMAWQPVRRQQPKHRRHHR
ncbi:MAG TPA: hypothetical protein VGF04_04505 [Solirubrobacterales bacterium]